MIAELRRHDVKASLSLMRGGAGGGGGVRKVNFWY